MIAAPGDSNPSDRDDAFVCCVVGDEHYALRGADVRLIARVEQMRVGHAADGRVGTLEVAGLNVPVFALAALLGRTATPADAMSTARYIAITGAVGELVGWLVDRIARPVVSSETIASTLPPILGTIATSWFEALLKLGDQSMLLIAPRQLNPSAHPAPPHDPSQVFHSTASTAPQPEPMVVIFSTPALPRCEAPRYALSGRQIVAIVQPSQQVVVPGSAPHVKGVFWWRDAVVPVVDFREDDESETASRRRHIIAQCGPRLNGSLVAFPIDADIAMHRPAADDRRIAGVTRPSFAHGMFDVNGETVALVSLDALLASAC